MTRITIFCDETWNSPDLDEPTGIHKLQGSFLNDPSKGQVYAYLPESVQMIVLMAVFKSSFINGAAAFSVGVWMAKSNKPLSSCAKPIKQTTRFISVRVRSRGLHGEVFCGHDP